MDHRWRSTFGKQHKLFIEPFSSCNILIRSSLNSSIWKSSLLSFKLGKEH